MTGRANAITPNGHTVASQLETQNSQAQLISFGSSTGPGYPGSGSMGLYQAVKLASRQPPSLAAPGSPAAKSLSRHRSRAVLVSPPRAVPPAGRSPHDDHTEAIAGGHCYIAGGQDIGTRAELVASGLPKGVSIAGNQLLSIPPGLDRSAGGEHVARGPAGRQLVRRQARSTTSCATASR